LAFALGKLENALTIAHFGGKSGITARIIWFHHVFAVLTAKTWALQQIICVVALAPMHTHKVLTCQLANVHMLWLLEIPILFFSKAQKSKHVPGRFTVDFTLSPFCAGLTDDYIVQSASPARIIFLESTCLEKPC
jgi:hypothetical protein